jgi:hypothetical protein
MDKEGGEPPPIGATKEDPGGSLLVGFLVVKKDNSEGFNFMPPRVLFLKKS